MLNFIFKPHRANLRAGTPDPQKLFVMLKLIPQQEVAQGRPPLAFALVIDTSGSMQEGSNPNTGSKYNQQMRDLERASTNQGTKLEWAIRAAHALIDDPRLQDTDHVTVIHFDDNAKTLLPLTPLARKHAAHEAVESLRRCSGGTHMAKGIRNAVQELRGLPPHVAKRMLLLTDGKTFDEEECRVLAAECAPDNTPVIAIGIGDEYNEHLMRHVSETSQGRPYHLHNMGQLRDILDVEVGSSVREVITDLRATVSTVKGITLDSFTRVYPSLADINVEEAPYHLGNIAAGDYTVFVLEFTAAGLARPASRVRLTQVGLTGHVPGFQRRDELPPQDLFVTFTPDENSVATVETEVLSYVQQRNVDRMVQDAMTQATTDAPLARQTLQAAKGVTHRIGNTPMTRLIDNALDELDRTGTISSGMRKTVSLGGRTRTIRIEPTSKNEGVPSEHEIRKLTGA